MFLFQGLFIILQFVRGHRGRVRMVVLDTTVWLSPDTAVSSTNKTAPHAIIIEIMFNVALNTIILTLHFACYIRDAVTSQTK